MLQYVRNVKFEGAFGRQLVFIISLFMRALQLGLLEDLKYIRLQVASSRVSEL